MLTPLLPRRLLLLPPMNPKLYPPPLPRRNASAPKCPSEMEIRPKMPHYRKALWKAPRQRQTFTPNLLQRFSQSSRLKSQNPRQKNVRPIFLRVVRENEHDEQQKHHTSLPLKLDV